MSTDFLQERVKLLQAEFQKAKQNLARLTEETENAKAHLSMVSGHVNEVSYLLAEEQKKAQAEKRETLKEPETQETSNGEAQGQTEECAA